MDADGTSVYIAIDNGTDKALFSQFSISSGSPTASGSNTATSLLDAADAVTAISFLNGGTPSFTAFRADGGSFSVVSGTVSTNSFKLSPVPNGNPTVSEDTSFAEVFFGLSGSATSGAYEIARYNAAGIEQTAITIAQNGITADSRFAVPLKSLRADHRRNTYALDAAGNLVVFSGF